MEVWVGTTTELVPGTVVMKIHDTLQLPLKVPTVPNEPPTLQMENLKPGGLNPPQSTDQAEESRHDSGRV